MNFQHVDHATVFPHSCVCGSNVAPLVDTLMELGGLRVYLCASCVGGAARVLGGVVLAVDHAAVQERERSARERVTLLEADHDAVVRRAHEAETKLDAVEAQLTMVQSERHELNAALVVQGRELTEARRAGYVTADVARERAAAEVQAAAVPVPKRRRRERVSS